MVVKYFLFSLPSLPAIIACSAASFGMAVCYGGERDKRYGRECFALMLGSLMEVSASRPKDCPDGPDTGQLNLIYDSRRLALAQEMIPRLEAQICNTFEEGDILLYQHYQA